MVKGRRDFNTMPRNSIGLLNVSWFQPSTEIQDVIKFNFSNVNSGFWTPSKNTDWYWPCIGAMVENELFVFAYQVYTVGSGQWGFAFRGTAVIHVRNPTASPREWISDAQLLKYSNNTLNWATAVTIVEDYLYLFGDSNEKNTVLSRIKLVDVILDNWDAMEFWANISGTTQWSSDPSVVPNQLATVLDTRISEATVQFHTYLNKWFILNVEFLATTILIATADELEGPWSSWSPVYELPAPYNETNIIFCYAVKAHPEFALPHEIVFSFMSNTFNVSLLKEYTNVYVPQLIRVEIQNSSSVMMM